MMFCSTECWNCEDKTCEHYFSKQDIYFKYKKIKSQKEELKKSLELIEAIVYANIPNIEIRIKIQEVLDKINELEGEKI